MRVRTFPSQVAITIALPPLALLAAHLFQPWLETNFDPLFLATTGATAWFCGVRCAVCSAVLSALAVDYFLLPPYDSFSLPDSIVRAKFFLFLVCNAAVIALVRHARSAHEESAESNQRYRTLSELIPFGSWTADSRGNMIQLSESFLKTFNTTMEECRGLGWIRLLEESDRTQVLAEWRACMKSGYFWDCEYRLHGPSGAIYNVLSRGIPVRGASGKPLNWVGIHLDITERERSTQERIEQVRDIARFNAELEQFAYVSAHDLQEPLRMIASYLQLLSRRYTGKLDSDADTYIAYAVEGAQRLQALLQDLLELQQVGKQDKPRVHAPLGQAVNKACANLATQIARLDARITWSELPTIEYQEQRFVQLFVHLLENGLKYHCEGTPPEITISATLRKPSLWEIRVRDNGIGIPEQFRTKIFDVFQRLHPRSKYPGTGIGLAICKKIVEIHGGHIWVEEPADGTGSTFCFTAPVSRERAT